MLHNPHQKHHLGLLRQTSFLRRYLGILRDILKYILVVTDIFSEWVGAFALRSTDMETLATVLVNEVICRYGVPTTLHSDQGANLTSQVISSLCKCLGIEHTQTTACHPQAMLAKVFFASSP